MANGYVARGGTNTSNWAGGVYNGSKVSQQFYLPYLPNNLDPATGRCYVTIYQTSVWLYNALAQTDATVKVFYGTGSNTITAQSANITLNNTTAAEKIGNFTDQSAYSTAANTNVRYFGFTMTNTGYFNQYYDSTGTGTTGYRMYVDGVLTNGTSGPFKWGSSTTRWETSSELRGRAYYYSLPTAPSAPGLVSSNSTSITLSASPSTDDGYGTSGSAITAYRITKDGGTTYTDFSTTSGASRSDMVISGLTSNTNYDFNVALINGVATLAGATVSGPYSANGTYRTKLEAPTVSGSYDATAYVNQVYSSSVTFSQAAGGGAVASTLTYSSSGLPNGLTMTNGTISGTPTTPGTYNVTVTATNGDGLSVSSNVTITVLPLGPLVSPSAGTAPNTRSTVKVWNGTSFVDGTMLVYDGTTPYSLSGWKYLK